MHESDGIRVYVNNSKESYYVDVSEQVWSSPAALRGLFQLLDDLGLEPLEPELGAMECLDEGGFRLWLIPANGVQP